MSPRELVVASSVDEHDEQRILREGIEEGVSQGSPLQPPTPPPLNMSLWSEVKEQFKTAYPTLIGMAVSKIPWLLSLRFVGEIGSTELAAAALATTLCNVTGLSLSVGLSSALTTLTGQARGELQARKEKRIQQRQSSIQTNVSREDGGEAISIPEGAEPLDENESENLEMEGLLNNIPYNINAKISGLNQGSTAAKSDPLMPLVYLYRGIIIQLACVLPVGCWWLSGIRSTLVQLGQGEELSVMTQDYLRILAIQLWGYSICWTLTAWLQAMEMAFVPAYAAIAVLITHIPLNLLYIHVFDWGYLGCAAATATTTTLQLVYIAVYLFGTKRGRDKLMENMYASAVGRSTLGFVKEARMAIQWKGILQYLGLALPGECRRNSGTSS